MIKNIVSEIWDSRQRRKKILLAAASFLVLAGLLIGASMMKDDFILEDQSYAPKTEISLESNFEGDIYFNDVANTEIFSNLLVEEIGKAKESIDLRMFSFSLPRVQEALLEAEARGVAVNIVLDRSKEEQHDEVFGKTSVFEITEVGGDIKRAGDYMHHKFLLIDKDTDDAKLLAGSFNYTEFQENYDPSFVLVTEDTSLIEGFVEESLLIEGDKRGYKKFREEEYKPFNRKISYANGEMELWFGPGFKSNSVKERMLNLLDEAEEKIEIVIWQLTDNDIAKKLYEKSLAGVEVKIITDDYYIWGDASAFNLFFGRAVKDRNENVHLVSDLYRSLDFSNKIDSSDYFNPYLHQHSLIIDEEKLLTGTNNWTFNGFFKNDEMIIITDIPEFVSEFKNSFDYHWSELNGLKLEYNVVDLSLSFEEEDSLIGKRLYVYKEKSEMKTLPLPCYEGAIEDFTVDLPQICKSQHTMYMILNDQNRLISNGYLDFY